MSLLTSADARAAGLSSAAVRWRIRTGRWQEVRPRVHCTHTGPLTVEEHCRAALLYAGRGAVLSHTTAAAVHGLAGAPLWPVHVTVPHGRRIRAGAGLVVHRSTRAGGVTARRGLAVHRMERAVLDIASEWPEQATVVLAAAVQQGLTTPTKLQACFETVPRALPHRTSIARVLRDVADGSRSELEMRCVAILRAAGLPEPARNHPVRLGQRTLWLDLAYPERRIALEIDGRSFHLGVSDWRRDLGRQNELVLAGWRCSASRARTCGTGPTTSPPAYGRR